MNEVTNKKKERIDLLGASRFLEIAETHLDRIKNINKGDMISLCGEEVYHGLIVNVFCACAIEAAVNSFILIRVCFYTVKRIRDLFKRVILDNMKRLNIGDKLAVVDSLFPGLNLEGRRDIKALFSFRNRIMHFSGKYFEGKVKTVPERGKLRVITEYKRQIHYDGVLYESVYLAKSHYSTAKRVVDILGHHVTRGRLYKF